MPAATTTKGVSPSVMRGRAISATFNTAAGSNCPAYQVAGGQATLHNTVSSVMVPAGSGTRSFIRVMTGEQGAAWCTLLHKPNTVDAKARFPALSKLSTGHRTLKYCDVVIEHIHAHCIVLRRRMQHAVQELNL